MNGRTRRIADIAVLGVFICLTLLINFFHTERTLEHGPPCPACRLQSSSLATQVAHGVIVPRTDFVRTVVAFALVDYDFVVLPDLNPRGPPQV